MERHRCGLLAAWSTAWLSGRVSYDDVIDAVVDDEVHRVAGLPGQTDPVPLGWALSSLREHGETRMRAVLPVPGDPRGLPGPGAFSTAAMQAGEGVLGSRLGLTPDIGDGTVLWTAHAVAGGQPGPATGAVSEADPLTVSEADHDLAETLRAAARALTALDVARWRPEVVGLLRGTSHGDRRLQLPPGHDQRALRLAERAQRLVDVLDLALADAPGGAVTGHDARARDEALRPLATAVRRALMAAYNA
ncbi:MAG: hypothetical protein H0V10_05345 [Geodermatophilaceae bacterium]|nr:hypothetical protein [Geodermatophilaceae bacterium]